MVIYEDSSVAEDFVGLSLESTVSGAQDFYNEDFSSLGSDDAVFQGSREHFYE